MESRGGAAAGGAARMSQVSTTLLQTYVGTYAVPNVCTEAISKLANMDSPHMYNEGVVSGLAYHCYVIAPALQPISAILAQTFHKLEPECYRNGLLQVCARLPMRFCN